MLKYVLSAINTVSLPQFQDWTDGYGMMQDNNEQETEGNGNLFTAHYVFGLFVTMQLNAQERERIVQVYKNNMPDPGLLLRAPGTKSRQAQDDIFGMMGAEACLYPNRDDRKLTKLVYEYGKNSNPTELEANANDTDKKVFKWLKILTGRRRWVWNTEQPGTFQAGSWLGRFPNLMATAQMSQGEWVNPFFWIYWAATMLQLCVQGMNAGGHDGYILRFHSALACQGYGPITNLICRLVRNKVKADFGGFGQLLGAYFAKPEHPIVALCRDKV